MHIHTIGIFMVKMLQAMKNKTYNSLSDQVNLMNHIVNNQYEPCSDQKIARFRTHDLRNNFSICEY